MMLQKGAEELEKKIANFTTSLLQIIFAGYIVIVSFWLLEAVYWRVQVSYMKKASILAEYLNDLKALDDTFRDKLVPEGLVYPLGSLRSDPKISFLSALKAPSIAIFYGFLLVATSVILGISSNI